MQELQCGSLLIGTNAECSQRQDELDGSDEDVAKVKEVKRRRKVSNVLLYNIQKQVNDV